jgi:hypothetical protein
MSIYYPCRFFIVVVSFSLREWTIERAYYTSGSALFSCDYLLLLLYSMTFVYCCLSLLYSLLFICFSLSSNFFFLCINRSLLYCESQMMVTLVIMTFIYHIRSVMLFAHIYLYINISRANRLNTIQATSCVNNSSTDQFLTFSLFFLSHSAYWWEWMVYSDIRVYSSMFYHHTTAKYDFSIKMMICYFLNMMLF